MRTIAILFLAALLSLPLFAQQKTAPVSASGQSGAAATSALPENAATKEQLLKLFDVLAINKQLQSVVQSMASSMDQMMPMANLTDKQKDEMNKLQAEMLAKMMSPDFIDTYLLEMVPIYQKHFTKADVDQLIAFYSSVVGQKFINEQPLITQETFPKVIPLMQQRVQDVLKEMNYDQRLKQIFAEEPEGKPKT